ncbi:hypothetical protein [Spirulina major]|uniref:hypothetical protein n=1 Tax=Spirulina major TaxID=270636 RepID=UPI0009330855|nr:hypothetical protein [Spirulina major]
MAASDEFRQYLKEGKVVDALTLALGEAIELEITTWVSTDDSAVLGEPSPGARMRTRMNLVDGDINNEVGSQFIGSGPYTELRDFHLQQVQEGRDIIKQNLESLQQMFVLLARTVDRLPKNTRNPSLPPQ